MCAGWREGGSGTPSAFRHLFHCGRLDSSAGSTMIRLEEVFDSRRSRINSIVTSKECFSLCSSMRSVDDSGGVDSGWCGGTHRGRSDWVLIGCWSSRSMPWCPSLKFPGWANWWMGQCLETASMSSMCERGSSGGWSSMIMPSTSSRENGFSPLFNPPMMREATKSG